MSPPFRQIRATYDEHTIRVYQAYRDEIAVPALRAQRFVPPFGRSRMTWIKPSFTWMMYRCGYATKEGQTRVLAIDVTREGFEWALAHASLSHFDPTTDGDPDAWRARLDASPVRIQWDPERTIHFDALAWRSLQVGIGGDAVPLYVDAWTTRITDVTGLATEVDALRRARRDDEATALLPVERPYPLSAELALRIGATPPSAD